MEYAHPTCIPTKFVLHLKGTVTKFVLYLLDPTVLKLEDISCWILFLSRKGIKEVTLINHFTTPLKFKLPTHLFSCLELKHLKLYRCLIYPPPSFRGFPNLSSLELESARFESTSVGDFINWCPLLEILIFIGYDSVNKMKPVEIARCRNLKTLAFPLCMLDDMTIIQPFGFLPKLQNLDLNFYRCKLVAEAGARNRLPTAFSSLKTLTLSAINISDGVMLSCGFGIICGCPNLQTLNITGDKILAPSAPEITSSEVDYNTMEQFQLRSVVFEFFIDTEDVVCFIKCLLARSPLLKVVFIRPIFCLQSDEKLTFARKLLKLHRASPIAEIDFY